MNKQIKAGVILQYVQMALYIVINIVYTPIMLNILGKNEYGIYNLASSIIAYLNLLSLGFGASYIRFYSRYKKDNDIDGIKKMNGLYLIVFSIIGVIGLIAGLFMAFNVNIFFNDTYTANDMHIAKTLMLFLSVNLALSFPSSVFVSYVTAHEKFIFQKVINLGKTILSPLLCIAFLLLGYGSIGMVIVTTILTITIDLINVFYCLTKLKMRFNFKNPNFGLLKEIFYFSIFIAINQIIDQINWQTDKIILGKMIDGAAVALYAVAATINNLYLQFSTAISSVFTPRIHSIVQKKDENMNNQLTELFTNVSRIQFFVLILVLTGFIFFGRFFIMKWAGDDYEMSYYIILLLICPVTIPLIQNMGIEIQRAKNKHQFRSIVYLIMAVLNIGVSILGCHLFGVVGVAIGTTISLVIANGFIMNIYYHKVIGLDMKYFWKSILSILPALIAPITVGVGVTFIKYTEIWQFIILAGLYSVIYLISIYLFGLNKIEKEYVNKIIIKILSIPGKLFKKVKERKQRANERRNDNESKYYNGGGKNL